MYVDSKVTSQRATKITDQRSVIAKPRVVNSFVVNVPVCLALQNLVKSAYATPMKREISTVERRLAIALARKRDQRTKLEAEIAALELQMRRARRTGVQTVTAERSTSVRRLTVEAAIVRRLSQSVPPETTADQLWPIVQALGVKSRSTFRSHLRRMSEKGTLVSPSAGRWRLAPGVERVFDTSPELADALARIAKP